MNSKATQPITATYQGQSPALTWAVVCATNCQNFLSKPFREAAIFATIKKQIGVRYDSKDQTLHKEDKPDSFIIPNPSCLQNLPVEWVASMKQIVFQSS